MDPLQRIRDLAVSESGFVFDPYTGNTFSVNAPGRTILEGLRQELAREQIVELLHERFETHQEDITRDLDDFVGILRREGIIPVDFSL
jgi:hypothetical protein